MEKALDDLGCHDKELSILFTSDEGIAQLNHQYLGRQGPTNVIAFPMAPVSQDEPDSPLLGDIVVSVDTAVREARETGYSLMDTLGRLLIHGLLHLLGYDHETCDKDAKRMAQEEDRLMKIFKEA